MPASLPSDFCPLGSFLRKVFSRGRLHKPVQYSQGARWLTHPNREVLLETDGAGSPVRREEQGHGLRFRAAAPARGSLARASGWWAFLLRARIASEMRGAGEGSLH